MSAPAKQPWVGVQGTRCFPSTSKEWCAELASARGRRTDQWRGCEFPRFIDMLYCVPGMGPESAPSMSDRGMSRTWFMNSAFGRTAFSGDVEPWREKYRLNDTRLNSLQSLLEPVACAAAGVCDCSEQTRALSPRGAETRVDDAKASGADEKPSAIDRSPSAQRTAVARRVIIVLLLQTFFWFLENMTSACAP